MSFPANVKPVWLVRVEQPTGALEQTYENEIEARKVEQDYRRAGFQVELRQAVITDARLPDNCSFCGRPRGDVQFMIAGRINSGAGICDMCIDTCSDMARALKPI